MTGRPQAVRTRRDLARVRDGWGADSVAVVMTMGALHAGHESLIQQARQCATRVIVTVFVNPLQFAAGEDLARYPQDFPADLARCAALGADAVFAPTVEDMYPGGEPLVTVDAGLLGQRLEGRSRPGHFTGMLTVVSKLLHLTRPNYAIFGQKDAQQLLLIRRMVSDLEFAVKIVASPTVREPGGLALSSRNAFLSAQERGAALALSAALAAGRAGAEAGAADVLARAQAVLGAEPLAVIDYLELVDPDLLTPVSPEHVGPALLAVAARIGTTRLIDNEIMTLRTP